MAAMDQYEGQMHHHVICLNIVRCPVHDTHLGQLSHWCRMSDCLWKLMVLLSTVACIREIFHYTLCFCWLLYLAGTVILIAV